MDTFDNGLLAPVSPVFPIGSRLPKNNDDNGKLKKESAPFQKTLDAELEKQTKSKPVKKLADDLFAPLQAYVGVHKMVYFCK